MKKDKINNEFDEIIGGQESRELTKNEHDKIREHRRKLYEERSSDDKVNDILTGFRFKLRNYADDKGSGNVVLLGEFIDAILSQMEIKKKHFAEYIDISPRNINKYFSGERKFNIDHALKLESMFGISAKILLEVQLKNDLLKAKASNKDEYNKYQLKDLLSKA
ncbi:hypothetical protein GCM10009122_25450 [Fulvivirga kasyanovii]|uniref:Helix-turn-helix domain-containing protein n=1 Tax=Fulvivirga kasyanovii TaxID=396812 RepID=A0ABW9RY94_9BACT|nr:helix-turn-helix domain-containing protein [Fulvivirga kasyanovii]MTI28676.1 helix-turn-helix domain-containing protein [Fulvivirga kasyanovii]